MYYTYVLISQSSGRLYVGSCKDLSDRLKRHNENRSKATKGHGPWELYWARPFKTRSEAVRLERKIKSFKNPKYVMKWIADNKEFWDIFG